MTTCTCGDKLQPCGQHVEKDPDNPCLDCYKAVTVTVTMLCESADKAAIVVEEAITDILEKQDVNELYDFDWEYISTNGDVGCDRRNPKSHTAKTYAVGIDTRVEVEAGDDWDEDRIKEAGLQAFQDMLFHFTSLEYYDMSVEEEEH